MTRFPVCAYAARQVPMDGTGESDLEVVVCNDGSCWTLTEDPVTKVLVWSRDGVPPIPGTIAALTAALISDPKPA